MKPVKFKECNVVFGDGQKEYQPLPALRFGDGTVVMCWKMSFSELLNVVLHRRIWVSLLTFNKPLQPTFVSADRKEMFEVTTHE